MTDQTITEQFPWAVPGTDAYIYQPDSWGPGELRAVKIERATKSRVTVRQGSSDYTRQFYAPKYGRALIEHGADRYRSAELIAADDRRVPETLAAQKLRDAERGATAACNGFAKSRTVEAAQAAIEKLQAWVVAQTETERA
jgi:hypothetical protein